ncbi:hypothetical protein E7T06_05340 [Deinococcus sp. Arct2-2]|uniref:type III-A CRISPR-associated protein Cas10/Csm1 n=1 Tax=Deinococcus sp. Arct2-2 TaxID=2568653 RepID=UPI0010A4942B|nr:hypothetical protein [Deinococcus sp. Arct2-2]THF70980.1 hypothetical protein E7T06_05340 [Deinococcus sp. Arct2-2]
MEQTVQALLRHLRSGKAQGLDVLFQRLGEAGAYRTASLRYPLVENQPLIPTFPGTTSQSKLLADALEKHLKQAHTPEAQFTLLERFGGFVAAQNTAGQEVGGVSWFDQVRLDAALNTCGEQVLVVRADLSGIQDFIYRVESDKALKSLRARSFYLELLAVHALRHLLTLCSVTRANVAYLGGGGFQLYLPAHCEDQVRAYTQRFDDWLWDAHQGALGFSLALISVSRAEAEGAGDFQRDLAEQLSAQKARRRRGKLSAVFAEVTSPQERLAQEEQLADALVAFGGLLPRATHIEIRMPQDIEGRGWVVLHDRAYRPLRQGPATPLPAERLALNSFEDGDAFPLMTGNYVTRVLDVPGSLRLLAEEENSRSVATHEQLADLALGQPRLALFRCDADNMGTYFSGGIPGHSAARHATLSRLLSLFFQGYVNAICAQRGALLPGIPQAERSAEAGHGRYLNIIYSGGDDAVVVGAWNEVLTFAVDLRRAYRKFTGGNEKLGLSGGAFIAKAKYPLLRMAERAYEAEQLAKQAKHQGAVVKDGFVPFLTLDAPGDDPRAAVRWNAFAALDDSGTGLDHTLNVLSAFLALGSKANSVSGIELTTKRAFLWKLQAFAEREGDAWRLPLLHYALARATPPADQHTEWQNLQRVLLQKSTWDHLGHVLGFLHLARPSAGERKD